METRSKMRLFLCALAVGLLGASVQAELYILGQITGGSMDLCPDAFTMEVTDQGEQALFTFSNNCSTDGVLSRIFFMKNDLITFHSVFDASEGVAFSLNEKNAMLPGGSPLGFTPHNTFSINADPARPKNGLHYEDFVSILFDMTEGISFDMLTDAIDGQSLGVGVHAQALPGGASVSFSTIPEPATMVLVGLGALLFKPKKRGCVTKKLIRH